MSPGQEAQLFREAMADVTRISDNRYWRPPAGHVTPREDTSGEESAAVEALESLVYSGEGFVISQTSEYMEAAGPGVGPEITRRLHQGRYAIQDHIDLHGYSAQAAQEALHAFVQNALERDRRAILVIHGRGLTSPGEPVLKLKVFEWLTRGPLRKYVIALTSARSCDGGAGATYVLLRRRPLTKRSRRR
jgi:DNA-nicking Smr family endonuclease